MEFSNFENEYGATRRPYGSLEPAALESLTPALPAELIEFLVQTGQASFGDGLLWTVDPKPWEPILNGWGPLVAPSVAFARTALGEVFIWEGNDISVIRPSISELWVASFEPKTLFGYTFLDLRYRKNVLRQALVKRCQRRLGALNPDEMFGASPEYDACATYDENTLQKISIFDYHRARAALQPLRRRSL